MAAPPQRRLSVKERIAAVEQKAKASDKTLFLDQFNGNAAGADGAKGKTPPSLSKAAVASSSSSSPRRRVAKLLPAGIASVDCGRVEQAEKAHRVVKKQAGREIARINMLLEANREALQRDASPVLARNDLQQTRVDTLRAEQAEMRRDVRTQIERQLHSARERIAMLEEETQIITEALVEMNLEEGQEEEDEAATEVSG